MANKDIPQIMGVCHVGVHAEDPAALSEFYQDVMGMQPVGGSPGSAFLSSRPTEESHEIVFFANPAGKHTAFRVKTLADLRTFYRQIVDRGVPIKRAVNHGVSLAFYFDDPEGNTIEIYWRTGLSYGQPYGHNIDLSLPEEALLQDVSELAARVDAPNSSGAETG